MLTMTADEAKNRFSLLLDVARREMVAITHQGETAAILVSSEDFSDLQELRRRRREALADFTAWRQEACLSQTPEQTAFAAALTDE